MPLVKGAGSPALGDGSTAQREAGHSPALGEPPPRMGQELTALSAKRASQGPSQGSGLATRSLVRWELGQTVPLFLGVC